MNPIRYLKKNKGINLVLIFAWMSFIFICSSLEGDSIPNQIPQIANPLHTIMYFFLAILVYPSLFEKNNALLYAILLSSFYGVFDEFHQFFVHLRFFSLSDVFFDLIGSVIGAYTAKRIGGG